MRQAKGPAATDLATDIELLGSADPPVPWTQVSSSKFARVYHDADRRLFFKEFLPRSRFDIVKSWIRGDRSIRARQRTLNLIALGFNTPQPVAWGHYQRHRGYLVTAAVDAIGVTQWLQNKPSRESRIQLLTAMGREIGRLHRAGVVHGDLRTSNVLVADEEAGFKFFFIDNERNSLHRTIPIKLVKKNLVQLDMLRPGELSLSDRLRFMRHYLESYGRFQGSDARALIGAVHKRALERLAAKDRR